MHMGDRSPEAAASDRRHSLAGPDRVGAVGRDRHRPQAVGKHEVEDGKVVRGEVPEHVDVVLDSPRLIRTESKNWMSPSVAVGNARRKHSTAGV